MVAGDRARENRVHLAARRRTGTTVDRGTLHGHRASAVLRRRVPEPVPRGLRGRSPSFRSPSWCPCRRDDAVLAAAVGAAAVVLTGCIITLTDSADDWPGRGRTDRCVVRYQAGDSADGPPGAAYDAALGLLVRGRMAGPSIPGVPTCGGRDGLQTGSVLTLTLTGATGGRGANACPGAATLQPEAVVGPEAAGGNLIPYIDGVTIATAVAEGTLAGRPLFRVPRPVHPEPRSERCAHARRAAALAVIARARLRDPDHIRALLRRLGGDVGAGAVSARRLPAARARASSSRRCRWRRWALVVNDVWLKPAFHSALTGKLSDVAVCFFMPLLLSELLGIFCALATAAPPTGGRDRHRVAVRRAGGRRRRSPPGTGRPRASGRISASTGVFA